MTMISEPRRTDSSTTARPAFRARNAGRAIVDEAERRNSEIIVMGAPRRGASRLRGKIFGDTVDFVLRHAPMRVMVVAARAVA